MLSTSMRHGLIFERNIIAVVDISSSPCLYPECLVEGLNHSNEDIFVLPRYMEYVFGSFPVGDGD